jgi:hypothetical protein
MNLIAVNLFYTQCIFFLQLNVEYLKQRLNINTFTSWHCACKTTSK